MRPLHSLLVALALVCACALGLFLVRTSSTRVDVAAPVSAAGAGERPAQSAAPLLPAGASQGEQRTELTARQTLPEPSEASQVDRGERGGADLKLTGRVTDAAGQGLAGARVYAASSRAGLAWLSGVPLDARGAGEWEWLRRRETTSGPDGHFELSGLRPGSLRLAVRHPGCAPLDEDGRALPAEEHVDLGEIRLEPGALVSGRVVDARGAPVAGAAVLRHPNAAQVAVVGRFGAGNGALVATTGEDGGFRVDQLSVGPWALSVESDQHPHALIHGTTSRPGEHVDGLLVTLEEGAEILGSVRGVPPGESLSVRALPRGPGPQEVPVGELTPPPPVEVRQAEVAADGSFRLAGLRPGHFYELGLTRASRRDGPFGFGWSAGLAAPVRARAGERAVELVYQPESALVFQALDARSAQPVEEFRVEAGIDWRLPQVGEDGQPLLARPQGHARVGTQRPRSPADKARLRVIAVGYAPYEVEDLQLLAGQDTDLGAIYLEPLPMLSVRVVDAQSGTVIEGASVTLSEVRPQRQGRFGQRIEIDIEAGDSEGDGGLMMPGDSRQRARTDAEGIARLTIPQAASCRLSVRHEGHAPWRSEVFPAPGAATEREVRLGRGGQVTVRLLGPDGAPVAGGRIEHQAPGVDGGFAASPLGGRVQVTNAQGEAVFEHLEPGTHRFRRARDGGGGFFTDGGDAVMVRMAGMSGEERGWVEALVSEGGASEVELRAPLQLAVEGRVREAGEPLAGATVELTRRESGGGAPGMPLLGGGGPSTETDGQGRYRLEGVESGEYTLSVRHPSRAMPSELELRVRESDVRQDLDLTVAIVEGRITDEGGEPLAGVRVWPERARAQGRATMVRVMAFASTDGGGSVVSLDDGGFPAVQARTGPDGRYQLRGVAPDVDIQVRAEGKGVQPARSEALRVAHDEVRRGVDLVLKTAGRVEISAWRSDGSPARNVLVTLTLEPGAEGQEAEQRTEFVGEEGRAVIDGLVPGTWRLTAQVLGPGEEDQIPDQTVVVRAGEATQATIEVP